MDNWRAKDPLPLLLILLTFTTGLIDAVSYLGLGHVFTANMTGNVVFLGFAVAGAKGLSISSSLFALGAFLVGAAFGGRLGVWMADGPRHRWLLTFAVIETVLLVAAAIAAQGVHLVASDSTRAPIIVLMALAMGLRNTTVLRLAVPDLTATVLARGRSPASPPTRGSVEAPIRAPSDGSARWPRCSGALCSVGLWCCTPGWRALSYSPR